MTQKVTKAVIPVAGLGTRMLPATKAIPKEMLTLVDRPLIQYVVEEAAAAGIREIVLVTHASKNSIENHFDSSFELEAQLESRVKRSLLEEVRSINPKDVTMISVRQAEAKGLGHAINCARPVLGNNPFVIMLPDVIIDRYYSDLGVENLAGMLKQYELTGDNQIMVNPVPEKDVGSYGVVDINGETLIAGGSAPIKTMVEKPEDGCAPSNLAITGRYVVSEKIWDLLAKTLPGAGGEIQLTDALHQLNKIENMSAYHIVGKTHDCGSKLGFIKANLEYSLQRPEFKDDLKQAITDLIADPNFEF
ncbi:MAG: UTP--glucose-1-phosphate uridylyltransferase [Psychrosphaera sp.]|jgi:UTP--glucose-1-phosphate uridylyltransferase|uniref:UTP--glucose-1-phosphate uridylyltransferase n=1 Tax=Psychrosphaera aquimarina TaxID=2044854 RepID=A0ABU3QXX5_9GAMM|nr:MULTISPECIES: UTP--glucose-1-phosphate uridylyltransferase GalU [Psychrosphaera]MBU2918369.1 UTP--glucose-1-phosphate uridylyltransferase GalU [Psychrosphaera sp. F3M07]MDU0112263.1 UTP--glucose-1-phosphate uridylyltransferase GalU [Psychrosphaera aquimarina]